MFTHLYRKDTTAKSQPTSISYKCTMPRNGGAVYRTIFFSDSFVEENGWKKGDRIYVGYCPEKHALGIRKVAHGEEEGLVRSLTKNHNSTCHHLKAVGEYSLPIIEERTELRVLEDRVEGHIVAYFPSKEVVDEASDNLIEVVEPIIEDDSEEESDDSEEVEDVYSELYGDFPASKSTHYDSDMSDDEADEIIATYTKFANSH